MSSPKAKSVQLIGIESFNFTVGLDGVLLIRVTNWDKNFIEFQFLTDNQGWREMTYSGSYLIEWDKSE